MSLLETARAWADADPHDGDRAEIEALIEFLGHTPVKTVYETIDLVKTQSARLEAAVPNPLALSHGTHLFSQYLMNSLKQPAATAGGGAPRPSRTPTRASRWFDNTCSATAVCLPSGPRRRGSASPSTPGATSATGRPS